MASSKRNAESWPLPLTNRGEKQVVRVAKGSGNKITLSMLVRNEAARYLRAVLTHAVEYVDEAVILDDASEDDTPEVCKEIFKAAGVPLTLVSNRESGFSNEWELRKQQWELTLATDPDWILCLDADEQFEQAARERIRRLVNQTLYDVVCFRLYDMWDADHYRSDGCWTAHRRYFPLLVRYQPHMSYHWRQTPVHRGRFPQDVLTLPVYRSDLRVKHLGWMDPGDRLRKYRRYREADPQGKYGVSAQYESILDPHPHLVVWQEY